MLCSINRAKITLFIIALVHIIAHLPYFWRYANTTAITLAGRCPYDLTKEFAVIYQILRMVLIDRLLPWLITLGFTVAMSVELYRDNKTRAQRLNVVANKTTIRRVTTMSLSVAWMFFILTFPTSIYEAIRLLMKEKVKISPFLYELFVYLLYLNSAINFYLYIIVAHKFREDFKRTTVFLSNRVLKMMRGNGENDTTAGNLNLPWTVCYIVFLVCPWNIYQNWHEGSNFDFIPKSLIILL